MTEKQPIFVLKLSLEEMALRRAVVNLWSEADALASIEDLRFELLPVDEDGSECQTTVENKVSKSDEWRETIETVKANLSELAIPGSLKNRMMHVVRPIGSEILRWRLLFHEAHLSDSREESHMHMQQLCWTSAGSVDYKKTAERLIHLQTIDVVKRYKLACLYCLEEDIPFLWKELPEEYKTSINGGLSHFPFKATPLEDYWAHLLKEEGNGPRQSDFSFHRHAFEYSARKGNKAAAEYFLQKLTDEERNSSLVDTANDVLIYGFASGFRRDFPKEAFSDLFCYLLSVMTPEEKVKLIKRQPIHIFGCLLDWPWQDLFLDTADIVCSFPKRNFGLVLNIISQKIRAGVCFPSILQEFFLRIPRDFRNQFVFLLFDSFFSACSCVPDAETFKMIFRNVDLVDGELVSDLSFSRLLYILIVIDEWHIVEVYLREASLSKEDVERLRENFGKFSRNLEDLLCEKDRTQRFYELLDKIEASAPIRKSSEMNH